MKKKFIILVNQPLNKTNLLRFDVNARYRKIEKIFWCLLPLHNKKIFSKYNTKDFRSIKSKNFKIFYSYIDLFKEILKLKKNFYYFNLAESHKYNIFHEFLLSKRCGKKIYRFFTDINAGVAKLNKKRNYKIRNLIKSFKNYLLNFIKVRPVLYFVESQLNLEELKNQGINSTKIIKINSFDFSEFKKIRKDKNIKKNIIFIDSNIEGSFESQLLGYKYKISRQKYWNVMEKIFKFYENRLNCEVIVASHFRRGIKDKPINRKFEFDKTPKLIRDAKLILSHQSQALHWAVYFKKPIILIDFENFDKISTYNSLLMNFYEKKLDLTRLRIDQNYNFELNTNILNLKINKKKYETFEKYFLSDPNNHAKENVGWDTICKNLN